MSSTISELPATTDAVFIRRAHQLVADLMSPNPAVYWADFLLSTAIGYAAAWAYLVAPNWSLFQAGGLVVAVLALYRVSTFTHELVHLPRARMRTFRIAWDVLFGVPFLMPSFTYANHREHHTRQTYGTTDDAEYYPYGHNPPALLLWNLLLTPLFPVVMIVRFGLLAPLSLLHPTFRRWVWERVSSINYFNPDYRRPPLEPDERRAAAVAEFGCFLVVVVGCTLPAVGIIPWSAVGKMYLGWVLALELSVLKFYSGHRWLGDRSPMTVLEQLRDTTTIPGGPWTELWAPLGLRYHALHHLFPAMPYHALGVAHQRLMRDLPPDSPYHATIRPSLFAVLWELAQSARRSVASGPRIDIDEA
jgi:fatty acid desaturase